MRQYCLYVIFKLWSGICGTWKTKNQTKYIIFASLTKFSAKFCSQVNFYKALSIRALQHKDIFLGLKSAKDQELFSHLKGSAHSKGRAGAWLWRTPPRWPSASTRSIAQLPQTHRISPDDNLAKFVGLFQFACFSEWEHNLAPFSVKRQPTKHDFHQASVFGPRFQHTLLQRSKEP